MNKTRSSKLTLKTQHPLRVILKMRNNHREVMHTIDNSAYSANQVDK